MKTDTSTNETGDESIDNQYEDEVIIEEETDGDQAHHTNQTNTKKLKKLKDKLKKAQEEKQQYLDELQRQKAEFQNLRKRDEQKKKQDIEHANEGLIAELLPVVDSFEMAFADKEAYEQTPENWRKGVEYIYAQLLTALESYGVLQLDPNGMPFDPALHDAIERVAVDDPATDNTVIDVIQKGYKLNDRIIRSAKVRVGEHTSNHSESNVNTEKE